MDLPDPSIVRTPGDISSLLFGTSVKLKFEYRTEPKKDASNAASSSVQVRLSQAGFLTQGVGWAGFGGNGGTAAV